METYDLKTETRIGNLTTIEIVNFCVQRLQKFLLQKFYLHLFTDCSIKITFHETVCKQMQIN